MQPPLPAPSATGAFIKTPFAHLLVYALERRLSGTFELMRGAAVTATILVIGGYPAKVRTEEGIHYLGDVMAELGMIDPQQLAASLAHMRSAPRPSLHGQILLEMGAVDAARLDAGLRAQIERKVEHLFSLPTETTFRYYDNVDLLSAFGGAPSAIDPFPVIWRGVRESPAWEHVDATLRRVGNAFLKASASSQFERFAFSGQEIQAVELLKQRPARMVEVSEIVGTSAGQLLVYLLMIMKQVDLVDPSQVQAPSPVPGGVALPPVPVSQANPSPPASGQAFARVQLTRQTPRNPLVVEEVVAPSNPHDERTSSPVKTAAALSPPATAFQPMAPPTEGAFGGSAVGGPAGAMDIGAMITTTIQQSSAPPSAGAAVPNPAIPPPPNAASISMPPAEDATSATTAGGPSPLTVEQTTLKTKILQRADQITSQDYFQMLGVDHDATAEQIQKAFFALAKVWHPDRLPPALVDVKDACSKVFTHLTEAHATLTDAPRRQDYMTLLRDGGATPDDQAKIQAILEAATEFQKAEFLLKRNTNDPQAYEIVKRCASLDSDQADYLATLAWLDAQRPEWMGREKTLEKCLVLERCIQKNPNCERAYFYRGLLLKRAGENNKALKDFKRSAELNPRNLDAMREVRLHNMRGGASKPPPGPASATGGPGGPGGSGPRGSKGPNKPAESESLGGLLGKLFKK